LVAQVPAHAKAQATKVPATESLTEQARRHHHRRRRRQKYSSENHDGN
jgi:hypothetical protein